MFAERCIKKYTGITISLITRSGVDTYYFLTVKRNTHFAHKCTRTSVTIPLSPFAIFATIAGLLSVDHKLSSYCTEVEMPKYLQLST